MTFAIGSGVYLCGKCVDETKCGNFMNHHGFKFSFFDLVLIISATVVAILCGTHVIQFPVGTYSFSGIAGGVFVLDLVALAAVLIKSKNKQNAEPQ